MKKKPKTFTFIFHLVLLQKCASEYLDVTLEQGIVRGYNSDQDDVFSFYGIPYATAPKGVNKYLGPLPPRTWEGILEATDNNTICLQQKFSSDQYYKFKRQLECLNINVFTPIRNTKFNVQKLPVFVVIHGGGFNNGYAMKMSPVAFTKTGIVTVTFNYRVGLLGFMCLGTTKVPGNAGLKDQVAALKWVQKNIKYFGGDPQRVTIAGCSSGAANVEALIVSPITKGLFSQAILESGSLMHIDLVETDHLKLAIDQAHSLGSNCVTKEEAEKFYISLNDKIFNKKIVTTCFLPCVENHNLDNGDKMFLVEEPIKTLMRGNFNKVSLIVAFTPTEGMYAMHLYEDKKRSMNEDILPFLPNTLLFTDRDEANIVTIPIEILYFPDSNITKAQYIDFVGDTYIVYPQYLFARLVSRSNSDVFMYSFNFRSTIALPGVDLSLGQGHTAETLYYLDYDERSIYKNENSRDRVLKKRLREYYYNFLKYGLPILNERKTKRKHSKLWLPFTEDTFFYMNIDKIDTLSQEPMKERFKIWNKIYWQKFDLPKPNNRFFRKARGRNYSRKNQP